MKQYSPLVYQNTALKTKSLQVGAFAEAIGVAKCTVRKWIKLGRLPGIRVQSNGYYQIPAYYVDAVRQGELPLAAQDERIKTIATTYR